MRKIKSVVATLAATVGKLLASPIAASRGTLISPTFLTGESGSRRGKRGLGAVAVSATVLLMTSGAVASPAFAAAARAAHPATSHAAPDAAVSLARLAQSHGHGVLLRLGHGGAAAAAPAARRRPEYQGSVSPRTSCGGFNGQVEWSNGTITENAYLDVWGELWNNKCAGATEYLYVNYTNGGAEYGPNIGKAGYNPTAGAHTNINWSTNSILDYGNISVDVCDNSNKGWHCGKPSIP
jgi:hypothetical protein